ncbi:MAG: hypothetical protein ACT4OI_02925 [Methanobacteriota archaeon]
MRDVTKETPAGPPERGTVPVGFGLPAPKRMPQVDYGRIFVLDDRAELLGEYALDDECPLEFEDLRRSIPMNGMRHLVAFYQGEYAFTPFRVDDLWFVVLTRGVPRIEDRGSIGSLLAAARVHLVPNLAPALAKREAILKEREKELHGRDLAVARREQRAVQVESELQLAGARLRELEADIRAREGKLIALRDYAVRMQRSFFRSVKGGDAPVTGGPTP